MQLVLLTNGHSHGVAIAKGLLARGIQLAAVVYEARLDWGDCRYTKLRRRTIENGLAGAALRFAYRRLRYVTVTLRYLRLGLHVVPIGNIHDNDAARTLGSLQPDLILFGGIGIVGPGILAQAKVAVLNAHPALLPWLRGTGVVARAVERGIPVGATCHIVDEGVDTGAILQRRLMPVDKSMYSIARLERAADRLAVDLLVDVVAKRVRGGTWDPSQARDSFIARCKSPGLTERKHIEELVRRGEAIKAFQQAVAKGLSAPDYNVPPDFSFSA
jgi:methionyl-tRNA formyltransferase